MPNAAGLKHWSLRPLHFAVQRWVLPEMMFGRGIDGFSYNTSAEVRAGRTAADVQGGDKTSHGNAGGLLSVAA
jgi:hypothetical protein